MRDAEPTRVKLPICVRVRKRLKYSAWPMASERVDAHITGTVWKIEVKEGEQVSEGQVLVILESMKMEMPVEAPRAGKVEKVHVTETQAVNEGDALVTLA